MRRTVVGVIALVGLVVAGCSSDGGGSDGARATTSSAGGSTTSADPTANGNPCGLTDVLEIASAYSAEPEPIPGRANCRYRVPGRGVVRFSVLAAGDETLRELAPDGEPVEGLGDEAQWVPAPDGRGGVLSVRTPKVILQFDARLDGEEGQVASQTTGWARAVLAGLEPEGPKGDDPAAATSIPLTAETPPCRLLTAKDAAGIFGEDAEGTESEDTCTYRTPGGTLVTVGPLTRPVSPAVLDTLERTSSVDGEQVPWPAADAKLSDGGLLLTNPNAEGDVVIYVVQGPELLRVTASADSAQDAENIAIVTAKAVYDNR